MDQRPYRLRSERLAQAVKLDRNEELMPGNEERVSAHVDVSGEIVDTIESPWGLSSSPHFDTIHKQTTPSLPSLPVVTPNHPVVRPNLSVVSQSLSIATSLHQYHTMMVNLVDQKDINGYVRPRTEDQLAIANQVGRVPARPVIT